MADTTAARALRELIASYNELNGATIDELYHEPSPLEFMRYVSRNTPFVIRGGAQWRAHQLWSPEYLKHELKGQMVNVAVTPVGNADAPTFSPRHDKTIVAKPHEEEQLFGDFLDYVISQETDPTFPSEAEVRYAQTRQSNPPPLYPLRNPSSHFIENDNFRNEYVTLFNDAQKDIPFARIALEKAPDAINLWVGNSHSVTCLHRDPMENIYVQVLGRKHFVLLPALCQPCVNEKMLAQAAYRRRGSTLELELDENGEHVPLATWDPENPHERASQLSALARPVHVTLDPGDMLYLPAMW